MKTGYFSFILFGSKIRTVIIRNSEQGTMTGFFVKDAEFDIMKDDLKDYIRKAIFEVTGSKADPLLAGNSSVMNIPEKLLCAAVAGMTRDGSLKCGVKLAGSMLLDVRHTFLINSQEETAELLNNDVLVISGGYDDYENTMMNEFILKLSRDPDMERSKPFVVYAGGSSSLPVAKLNMGPLTDLIWLPNVLENSFCPDALIAGEDISNKRTSSVFLSTDQLKVPVHPFSNALHKITDMFCTRYVSKAAAIFFTAEYSVINECSRVSGKNRFKRCGVPVRSGSLAVADFSKVFKDLNDNKNDLPGIDFELDDLFRIEKIEHAEYYRPDRIAGISLCENVDLDKFLDLICDPDILRGAVEFVFDKDAILLAAAPMFFDKHGDQSSWLLEVSNTDKVVSGWLVVPDGIFVKDRLCLTVYISGNEERNEMTFNWGKRYVINVEPYSVIEINGADKVYFKGKGSKKILKTSKHKRMIVFDLRKEKSS